MSVEEIRQTLLERYGSQDLVRLSGGFTNGTFLVQGSTPPVVLKVYSQGSSDANNEFRALQALSGSGLTPEVYDRLDVNGVTALLMAYRAGSNVQQALLEAGRTADAHRLYAEIGSSLAKRVHQHPLPSPHNIRKWDGQATADTATTTNLPFVPAPLLARARAAIERFALASADCAVTHGDFGPHNLLVGDDQQLTILDWEWAEVAPPAVDVAWLCWFTALHYAGEADPLCTAFLRAYQEQSGYLITPESLQQASVYRVIRVLEKVRHATPSVQAEWVRRLDWTLHYRFSHNP